MIGLFKKKFSIIPLYFGSNRTPIGNKGSIVRLLKTEHCRCRNISTRSLHG
jgi:hypothetical protein